MLVECPFGADCLAREISKTGVWTGRSPLHRLRASPTGRPSSCLTRLTVLGRRLIEIMDVLNPFPVFVAEIRTLFEPWQIADYLHTPRRLGALGHVASEETHGLFRAELDESEQLQEDARNLTLLEWAKELLLEEGGDT